MDSILKDLTKYKERISENKKNIFKYIDSIVKEVQTTNLEIKKINQNQESTEKAKSDEAILKVKK